MPVDEHRETLERLVVEQADATLAGLQERLPVRVGQPASLTMDPTPRSNTCLMAIHYLIRKSLVIGYHRYCSECDCSRLQDRFSDFCVKYASMFLEYSNLHEISFIANGR